MQRTIIKNLVTICGLAVLSTSSFAAVSVDDALKVVADRLRDEQSKEGIYVGSWPGELNFSGSIVAGISKAYQVTNDSTYNNSSVLGADCILALSQGNFYGDEALALAYLSMNSTDPNNNSWRDAVSDFYGKINLYEGTESYILNFYSMDPSLAVFYMANHVLAAYYVDALDKQIWRQELISLLSHVDDGSSVYPVLSLGVAVWALSQTGPLDETIIHSSLGQGAPYWDSKTLSELPDLLLSHQVQEGQPEAGSFYWQFRHTENSLKGYTEDAIFATLGMLAAYEVNPDPNLYTAIQSSRAKLMDGIGADGKVWEHLSQGSVSYYAYGGEMLQVLSELITAEDSTLDKSMDLMNVKIVVDCRFEEEDWFQTKK